MHILITRPAPQHHAIIQRLNALGHSTVHIPLMTIESVPLTDTMATQLLHCDSFIFTSRNAVQQLLSTLDDHPKRDQLLAHIHRTPCLAIGIKTAQLLAQFNIKVQQHAAPPYNSEALLQCPDVWPLLGQQCGLIKGLGGRTYLAEQLHSANKQVIEIDIYKRQAVAAKAITQQWQQAQQTTVIDVIMLTSVESSEILFSALNKEGLLDQCAASIIAGSARIAASISADWPSLSAQLRIAQCPTDEDMFKML